MDSNKEYVQILVQTLTKKEEILKEILVICKKQEQLSEMASFEMEAFDETLNSKSILIQELNQLDDGFDSIYQKVKKEFDFNKNLYKQEILQMQKYITRVTELGAEIRVSEQRNRVNIERQFGMKKQEIRQIRKSNQMASQYYKNMSNLQVIQSAFVDKKK